MTFEKIWSQVANHTMLDIRRGRSIYDHAVSCLGLPGNVVEIGCYNGGIVKLLAKIFPHRVVYAFDTFMGMPELNTLDNSIMSGTFKDTDLLLVKEYLLDCPNVRIIPGLFPDTFQKYMKTKYAFVHFDGDLYETMANCLNIFCPLLSGKMIIDDYGRIETPGVKTALDEFKDAEVELLFDYTVLVTSRRASPAASNNLNYTK